MSIAAVAILAACTNNSAQKATGIEGEVKVSFDSHGQVGVQQKIITISSNAENNVTTIQLKGTVEK